MIWTDKRIGRFREAFNENLDYQVCDGTQIRYYGPRHPSLIDSGELYLSVGSLLTNRETFLLERQLQNHPSVRSNLSEISLAEPMSLYYDAAPLLVSAPDAAGSLKFRVFSSKDLKCPPKQIFALVSEASKWSPVLVDVIEKSQLLQLELKVSVFASRPCRPECTD